MNYPNIFAQLFNTPLMLSQDMASTFADVFTRIAEGSLTINLNAPLKLDTDPLTTQREAFAGNVPTQRYANKKYIVTDTGIGILPIEGVLVQRRGQMNADCTPMESYQRLGNVFAQMMGDADVRGILMEIDSPGGQVSGNFDLARSMLAARTVKPVWAHANEMALSGGYSILSAAERAFAPRTGNLGSIGVIMQHVSQVEKDRKAGYVYTTIKSGAEKDVLNPHRELSKSDQQWAQAQVDRARDMFAQLVADGRGLDMQAVLDTEAGIFATPDAKQIGLIDDVATFAETLAAFEKRVASGIVAPRIFTASQPAALAPTPPLQETTMSGSAAAPAAPVPEAASNISATVNASVVTTDASSERTRIAAIIGSDEAKGRTDMANHLAFKTGMTADEAIALLAVSPVAASQSALSPLSQAMAGVPNPVVGSGSASVASGARMPMKSADVYAMRRKSTQPD